MKFISIPVTAYQQNCSLIWCEQTMHAAVIDPGGDLELILNAVKAHKVYLKKILLTHGHMDHVGGTAELSQQLALPIEGPHIDDKFWIEALDMQAQMMQFKPVDTFQPARWLKGDDQVTVGNIVLEVRHCPGHTPGHVIFFHQATRMAFVGDVLFKGSIGRTDFPKGNYDQLVESIQTQLWPLGDDVTFVPGHGPYSTFGHERKTNGFVADHKFG